MNQSNIPKIIHQIAPADKNKWHPFWKKCYDSWKQNFPNYEFILWNDLEDIDNFVKKHYPQYWNLYNLLPVHIMKIDFVRLCILHKYGGIYVDMDIFCYKNFENYITKDIYFLENTTKEYTSAEWENSMMASIPNHKLFEELMKYVQTCFIHYRNSFSDEGKHWRNQQNSEFVNNTTGSGMISEAIKTLNKYFDIGVFDCEKFNNRPMSYDKEFYTKHVHTSVWGNEYTEYTKNELDTLLILDGCSYSTGTISEQVISEFKKNKRDFQIVLNTDFDFYKDYTNSLYLKSDNLEKIKKIVCMKH